MRFPYSSYTCILIFILATIPLEGQKILSEKLGYSAEDKLLIIHADDLGLAHSENVASFLALQMGTVNSASIMMPCPWVPEVADYARNHPDHDLGLHLTVTSEWKTMKWGPVASLGRVKNLVDSLGYFFDDCSKFSASATAEEVETEMRAQIEKAISMGIDPTHLDTHMGCLVFSTPEIFEVYLKLGREYKIPCMIDRFSLGYVAEDIKNKLHKDDVMIDRIYSASPADASDMASYYDKTIKSLEPGVSTILIHLAFNDAEMQAVTADHPDWGAKWRQDDFNYFSSERCRKTLEESGVKLVTWRQIQEVAFKN